MIPFIELIDSYYSTLAIGEPEKKQIYTGKNSVSIPVQRNLPSGDKGK
jgi:hypothetical protein